MSRTVNLVWLHVLDCVCQRFKVFSFGEMFLGEFFQLMINLIVSCNAIFEVSTNHGEIPKHCAKIFTIFALSKNHLVSPENPDFLWVIQCTFTSFLQYSYNVKKF